MLIHNPRGNFSFLKGISPYSAGAIASPGFEIEHVRLLRPVPLKAGFEIVDRTIRSRQRHRQALCGMELRSPKPFTFAGFNQFNAGYVEVLQKWDVLMDGLNPVARTNIAPAYDPPSEPSLYGFSYTYPTGNASKAFIVAGAGELPEGSLDPHDVVRLGDVSAAGLAEKARYVMGLMEGRLKGLGVSWANVTTTNLYTVHNIHPLVEKEIVQPMGKGAQHGFVWHFSRPPIESIEFEMDVRGCRHEVTV
ncbi:MAG TPA: hypothetical protein VM120_21785 [Bryobacteraceae bacterium]|nr:hypothetical protein [Bryobacteraceae bacterium]